MTIQPLPPLELLQQVFVYNAETGELLRRVTTYNRRIRCQVLTDKLKPVSNRNSAGYIIAGFGWNLPYTRTLYAHRICWALHYSEDPYPLPLDHINRNKQDNRIANLRRVTHKENTANRSPEAVANAHSRKPVRITYPDGTETVTESLKEAGAILGRPPCTVNRTINNGGIVYSCGGTGARDSGIRVVWAK
jgi:hypothetical protein